MGGKTVRNALLLLLEFLVPGAFRIVSEVEVVCTVLNTKTWKPKESEIKRIIGLINAHDILEPCRKPRMPKDLSSYFRLRKQKEKT